MTFIASVIAQKGVAIVADSFVTTVDDVLSEDAFIEHLKKKKRIGKNISYKELLPLFQKKPSYTQNYMDKLFQFGMWSAVTTSGQAYINGKVIKDLIKEIEISMAVDSPAYDAMTSVQVLDLFCQLLKTEIIAHLVKRNLSSTSFVFSYFNRNTNVAQVFSIKIKERSKGNYLPTSPDLISYNDLSHLKIVTGGQDSFVDRLIFGSLYREIGKVKKGFLEYFLKKVKLSKSRKDSLANEVNHIDFLNKLILADVFSMDFRDLSLQEAVDLAALLIKIVMDIQIYTEKIPTVGGLIRLATISNPKGFEWVAGDKIICPKIIFFCKNIINEATSEN